MRASLRIDTEAAVQEDLAAQKAAAAAAAVIHKEQVNTLQREHIALLTQLASMVRVRGTASTHADVTTATGALSEAD